MNKNDIFMLNTRFVLIVTVVLGNLLMPVIPHDSGANAIVLTIFTFHMPVFVFVTGYFSKSFTEDPHYLQVLMRIFLQYVVFQTIYSTLDFFYFHTEGSIYSFWAPYWMLWFLLSHLFWKLLLLGFVKLKHPIAAAILLGTLIGYLPFDGFWLSAGRTFIFFPFFLAGYYYNGAGLRKAARHFSVKLTALAVLALLLALFYNGVFQLQLGWLLGSRTYTELHMHEWYAALFRLAVYVLAVVVSLAFLLLQTDKKSIVTEWGERTVYVFLTHGAALKLLAAAGVYRSAEHVGALWVLLGTGLILTLLLSHRKVAELTRPLIHPDPELLLGKMKKLLSHH